LFVAGCDWHLIVPSGPAPLRYRDQIFTSVTTTSNVVYGSAVNQQGVTVTLRLDVYQPTGDAAAARPAIVWIHGGSFRALNKTSPEIVDEATVFAKKGYVGVSIDYRLSTNGCTGGVTQECLTAITQAKEDAQAAVRFLRMNAATYHVDPNRIASAGTSAGAITALNVGYDPEHPGNSGNPGFLSSVRAAVSLSGAQLLTSPNAGEASALLFHGTADNLVPYQWAVNTINNAHAAGLDAFLTTWEGEGHVPYTEHRDQILGQTTNFLYWTLDVEHTGQ
jgi:acetyl esterase/lipase